MGRGHHEYINTNEMPWEEIRPGFLTKELSKDKLTGAQSRLLLLKKGVKISEYEAHTAGEEGYIIYGKLREGREGAPDEIIFTDGCYFFRPGGLLHGPWEAVEDTLSFLTLDRKLINIRNPPVWDCPKCKDKMLWQMKVCTNCGKQRPKSAKRHKMMPEVKTFVSTRR